jgi:hypothetical protein
LSFYGLAPLRLPSAAIAVTLGTDMAARQGSFEIKEYFVAAGRGTHQLTLSGAGNQTDPIWQLTLLFTDWLPPFRGKLLPSRQATCYAPLSAFGDIYHVVQTERPVYAYAWWDDVDNSVFDAFVATGPEPPGEGLSEPALGIIRWWEKMP